ncbi:hypothetical protein BC826DRAFT_1189251 [Russula brevipes]|nr:hypothetical protein BC826DRAFT_1189251 [Russula brevipes]
MPKDQEVHYSDIAEGVDPFLVGPMPADEFLAKFFPLYQPTPEEGAFSKVVEILGQKNQREKSMYEPFCSAVQHQVPGLVIRNTSSQIDNADTEYSFSIKPDCTVYSKANENVTGTDSRVAEFFIKFKYCPKHDPFRDFRDDGQPEGQRSFIKDSRDASFLIGQIGTYVAVQLSSQYRTHAFFVLIIGDCARLMRWDRSGAIFTAPIKYNDQPELLEFFKAYHHAAPEARGIDEYVRKPTEEEISTAIGACQGLSGDLLVVSLPDSHYVINSPNPCPSLPIGRSTRTSVAYDLKKTRVFMKDSWRVVAPNVAVEGDIIRKLNDRRTPHIPLCVDSCDVGDDKFHETKTGDFSNAAWVPSGFKFSFSKLRHHRLILDAVVKKLEQFSSTKELVCAIHDALVAHKKAYLEGVLHCDISPGNI